MATYRILGLMSGSSLDGLDVAYCELEWDGERITQWEIKAAETYGYTPQWARRLGNLWQQNALTFAKTHTYFGHYMGDLCNQFLRDTGLNPDFIASHGHTVFHNPHQMFTCQIGDGAALAVKTGLPVINDFRTHDVALSGEGAPLAPLADKYLFSEYAYLLNLGGIANFTHQGPDGRIAYDICPCNQSLNALSRLMDEEYDHNGSIAASGKTIPRLERFLHTFPYFSKTPPKSLVNSYIHHKFMPNVLEYEASVADKLHTLCRVFGKQIADNIMQYPVEGDAKLLLTGGGAHNAFLVDCIREHLEGNISMETPAPIIVDYKEAVLMALLGLLRVEQAYNSLAGITGAKMNSIGGSIYQGTKKLL